MRKLATIIVPIVVLISASSAIAQAIHYPRRLSGWLALPAATFKSDQLQKAIWSTCEWVVSMQQGQPSVTLAQEISTPAAALPLPFTIKPSLEFAKMPAAQIVTKVTDGWIVGFNAGEWGGSLWWFSPDGHSRYKISDQQVCGFIQTREGLLALEGLAHMGSSRGSLIRLTQNQKGRWHSDLFAALGNAPQIAAEDTDGAIVVVGAWKLKRVARSGKVQTLTPTVHWGVLYPTSIIRVHPGEFYVGLRGFVLHIRTVGTQCHVDLLQPRKGFLKNDSSLCDVHG